MDYLIIALGNPGKRYEATRHNVGWMVVDALSASTVWTSERSPVALESHSLRVSGATLHVVKPLTYMNLSGLAAAHMAARLRLPPERIVVVVDEYNFPVGRVHLRRGGSDGGHNGLTSVIEELGTDMFWRLRCGIDRKFGPGELVDYVLSPFSNEEQPARDAMIVTAVEALKLISAIGPEKAMQTINRVV